MKQVFSDSIIPIPDTDLFDHMYLFRISCSDDIRCSDFSPMMVDMSKLIQEFRNDRIDYKKDYKLWNQVYAPEHELEIFRNVLNSTLSD